MMVLSILNKSNMILNSLKTTIESFFSLHESLESKDEEQKQNILRAIILFSCSGVDAVVKQLINDTLGYVIDRDEGAFNQFKNFTADKIQGKNEINSKLLSELFVTENPKEILIMTLKKELTQNSLQSAEELFRVASYFNIETMKLEQNPRKLKEIFVARNQITHELDVDMDSKNFSMRHRDIDMVKDYSNHLLQLSEKFITLVENIIK